MRAIYPALQTVGVPVIAWVVRALGVYGTAVVYMFLFLELPVSIRAGITVASGLLFLSGLLAAVLRLEPSENRRQALRRLSGVVLVLLGMAMTFAGSFGVHFLYDPKETGTMPVMALVLFGPVYYLGLPVFLLGLWLLGFLRWRR